MGKRRTAADVMSIIHGFAGLYGFKRKELAAICEMTPQTWSKRERDPGTFSLKELIALSNSFNCTLGEITEGQGKGRYI